MKINSKTKISELLKQNINALEAIVSINQHFTKLRNPLLRKVMASRVNISQAAKIGKCSVEDFYNVLLPYGFEVDKSEIMNDNNEQSEKPNWLKNAEKLQIIDLDVRPIIAQHNDPFNEIISKTHELKSGQILCIINTFEPVPIIKILNSKGYESYVEYVNEDEVYSYFEITKSNNETTNNSEFLLTDNEQFENLTKNYTNKLKEVDVRSLEMPLPMLTILEELKNLPKEFALFVNHKKVPMYLLPELKELNFRYVICKISDEYYKLLIFR